MTKKLKLLGVTKQVKKEEVKLNTETGKEEEVITISNKSLVRIFSEKGIFDLK